MDVDRTFSFYQNLTQENQRLKEEINQMSSQKPDFSTAPENWQIAQQLRDLQLKILPSHALPPSNDAVQELDNLKKIVEAKLDSLAFVREKLRSENQKLTNQYQELQKSYK
jgi:PHP family Zn ribbon phosphoesterase